jgi:hypothetical protein
MLVLPKFCTDSKPVTTQLAALELYKPLRSSSLVINGFDQ